MPGRRLQLLPRRCQRDPMSACIAGDPRPRSGQFRIRAFYKSSEEERSERKGNKGYSSTSWDEVFSRTCLRHFFARLGFSVPAGLSLNIFHHIPQSSYVAASTTLQLPCNPIGERCLITMLTLHSDLAHQQLLFNPHVHPSCTKKP